MPTLARPAYESSVTLDSVKSPVHAVVEIPGSKSITNRALVIAALAEGESVLRKPLYSDDTEHMMAALNSLGARVVPLDSGDLHVSGVGAKLREPSETLFIGNSGTSVRFLAAACAHLPAGSSCVFDGVERMRKRPIQDLIDGLAPLGARVESLNGDGCPPVRVHGGGLRGGKTSINGGISSQYLSALMMTAPLAAAPVGIEIEGKLVSAPYVTMTEAVMASFGVEAKFRSEEGTVAAPAPQSYSGRDYIVEPDASSATYFLAAAAVAGGEVTVRGLGSASIQGDVHFAQALEAVGCTTLYHSDSITVRGPEVLRPVDINMVLMPDAALTMAVVCLFANGRSVIRGLDNLSVKETDRVAAVAAELRKLGAAVEAGADYWIIDPPANGPRPASIHTYDDHRMAMSFAVAGLRIDGLTIEEPGCVAKTFPDFWQRWDAAFYD